MLCVTAALKVVSAIFATSAFKLFRTRFDRLEALMLRLITEGSIESESLNAEGAEFAEPRPP